jgi:hypothetical protein
VSRILDEAGMKLLDVRFNRVNGGSFAVTAGHAATSIEPQRTLVTGS